MKIPIFKDVHPTLPSQDVSSSIDYYVNELGFDLEFQDNPSDPTYAGVRRGNVELHLQWHDPKEWTAVERPMLRFLIDEIDALFAEYQKQNVFHLNTELRNTAWGTREFAFYDLYGNGLTFYEEL